MSEGYTIDGLDDEVAGIVVRYQDERGFRFHSGSKTYEALDGHVFATPAAAQRAARELARTRSAHRVAGREKAGAGPIGAGDAGRDPLDRGRQLRVLMSSWI
jgi:hypothetical protein